MSEGSNYLLVHNEVNQALSTEIDDSSADGFDSWWPRIWKPRRLWIVAAIVNILGISAALTLCILFFWPASSGPLGYDQVMSFLRPADILKTSDQVQVIPLANPAVSTAFTQLTTSASPTIFLAQLGNGPLRAIALATLDSVWRHMPDARIKFYVALAEGTKTASPHLMKQLQFFIDVGLHIDIIIVRDPAAIWKDTPLEGLPILQRHVGGKRGRRKVRAKTERARAAHASDLLRFAMLYKEGGMWMDNDNILLKDLRLLFDHYGPAIVTNEDRKPQLRKCEAQKYCTGWIAFPAQHIVLRRTLEEVARVIRTYGPDCVMPWSRRISRKGCTWSQVGPDALTIGVRQVCSEISPLLINDIVLGEPEVQQTADERPLMQNFSRPVTSSLTVVSRKYMMPVYWDEEKFFEDLPTVPTSPGEWEQYFNRMSLLTTAYQLHVFKPIKYKWLEYMLAVDKFPLAHYVHAQSCRALCDVAVLQSLLVEA